MAVVNFVTALNFGCSELSLGCEAAESRSSQVQSTLNNQKVIGKIAVFPLYLLQTLQQSAFKTCQVL
jgi:hypothetical protein